MDFKTLLRPKRWKVAGKSHKSRCAFPGSVVYYFISCRRVRRRKWGAAVQILQSLTQARKLIRANWRALTVFELLMKTAAAVILLPLVTGGVNLAMRAAGFGYITLENVGILARSPLTWALILLALFAATALGLLDVGAVIYILDQSRQGRRARISHAVAFSARSTVRAFRWPNLPLALLMLLLAPLLHLGMLVGALTTVAIPEFILTYVSGHVLTVAAWFLAALIIEFLLCRWLFSFHLFTLTGASFRDSARRGAALTRGHQLTGFFSVLFCQALFALFYLTIFLLMVTLAVLISQFFKAQFMLQWVTSTVVWGVVVLCMLISFALATPISFALISQRLYARLTGLGECQDFTHPPLEDPQKRKRTRRIYAAAAVLIAASGIYLAVFMASGRLNPRIEYIRTTEITAHRGASAYYPENTMAAVRGAWELGADWAEIDVQMTRDGEIILMHDANTRRTTGVRGSVWDMTLEEIRRLDAGRWFSPDFAGEKVPTLREAAEYARDTGLKLNIELKPTGRETDFEQAVIDIIREYDLMDQCVITSQVYRVLENVKRIDDTVTTVYVTSLAFGDITRLSAADHFSVEATSATARLTSRVHNAGKQIYAWTVNNGNRMRTLIERNVDNIITDDILLARQCVDESRYSDLLSEFVKLIQ